MKERRHHPFAQNGNVKIQCATCTRKIEGYGDREGREVCSENMIQAKGRGSARIDPENHPRSRNSNRLRGLYTMFNRVTRSTDI